MRRPVGVLLAVAVVFPLHSCSVRGTIGREDLLANPPRTRRFDDFTGPPGQLVMSYTTTDGLAHGFQGRAWIEGDSMVFARGSKVADKSVDEALAGLRVTGGPVQKPGSRHRLAIASLSSVEAWDHDDVGTVILAVAVVGIGLGIAFAVVVSTMPPIIGW